MICFDANLTIILISIELKGDSGSGLVQYVDQYRSRAVLIGIARGYGCDNTVPKHKIVACFTRVTRVLKWIYGHRWR